MAFELPYALCFLLIIIFLKLPSFTASQSFKNISLGSSLIAQDDDQSFWPSPSGEFAFGFQNIGKDGYFILAIGFDKIPEKTIVWSAANGNLVPRGSTVELNLDGQLVLNDTSGESIVIAGPSVDQYDVLGVAYAAMLDTGNFVLANQNSLNLWQSFDHPTDTILPTQTLNRSSTLFAQYTPTNYSKGRFMFKLEHNGTPALYTTNFPLDSPNFPYWWLPTAGDYRVFFNQSGFVYLVDMDGIRVDDILPPTTQSLKDYYQRATLDFNGVLRHHIYPKRTAGIWSSVASTPPDFCMRIQETTGGGACGFNSLCVVEDEGPSCECPDGYVLTDPADVLKGCRQNFTAQSCDPDSPETDLFELKQMQFTDFPNGDYMHFQQVTEDWCNKSCLADCFCAIAIFMESIGDCWKKGIPLLNGRKHPDVGWKSMMKIRKTTDFSLRPAVPPPCSSKKDNSDSILVGSVVMLILTHIVVSIITYLVISRFYYRKAKMSRLYHGIQGINLKCFSYLELKQATNGFKEELGHGAFATVFKGVLGSDNGKCVAVKRLDSMVRENDLEFKAEVSAIGGTNHRNLVQLLGFCNEGQHRILVYEFMSNGSLASFLFGETRTRPSWHQRRKIAVGTARGLLYLHEECSSQIIHCDIKPQNILLDDNFTARIADFGVAKLLKTDQTRTNTRFRGTKGYVAPEWFKSLPVTVKADVYSFGILLLEIVCCRKHYEENIKDEDQMVLADWAYDCYNQEKLQLLLENDDDLDAKDEITKMETYLMIAFWCIQEDPSLRPTMKNVTKMLEEAVEVLVPPNPSSLYALSN